MCLRGGSTYHKMGRNDPCKPTAEVAEGVGNRRGETRCGCPHPCEVASRAARITQGESPELPREGFASDQINHDGHNDIRL